MSKKFALRDGHELRGFRFKVYPTKEQEEILQRLENEQRCVWNWLVKRREEATQANQAFAVREGLVPPRPVRPDYDGMSPEEAKSAAETHRAKVGAWSQACFEATKDRSECSYRLFKEELAHFERVISWRFEACASQAHLLQALAKSFFATSPRPKRFRRATDHMPVRVRSGDCLELGTFGARGKNEQFYNCQISINGLKIRGRTHRQPEGRVLEGVSLVKEADGWYASVKIEAPKRVLQDAIPGLRIGIDVGERDMIVTSEGRIVANPWTEEFNEKLAGRQQLKKPTGILQARMRRRIEHTMYTEIKRLERYEIVAVEDLSGDVLKRASGRLRFLRKFSSMAKQKLGARVREVNPCYTSQTCSQCGKVSKESWTSPAWPMGQCCACGHREHRDVNAARNILAKEA